MLKSVDLRPNVQIHRARSLRNVADLEGVARRQGDLARQRRSLLLILLGNLPSFGRFRLLVRLDLLLLLVGDCRTNGVNVVISLNHSCIVPLLRGQDLQDLLLELGVGCGHSDDTTFHWDFFCSWRILATFSFALAS